jgi:hypothetical protein
MECTSLNKSVRRLALCGIETVLVAKLIDIDGGKSGHPPRVAVVMDAGEGRRGLVVAHTEVATVCGILRRKVAWLTRAHGIPILAVRSAATALARDIVGCVRDR